VVDAPGDNLLSEFVSVVDAVQCAVNIQRELAKRNEELPEVRRMKFRIGVNLGDVVEEEDRLYGDGVNLAARLESMAEGGGVCISGAVYDQVKNKTDFGYEDLGEHFVKNFSEPIRMYKIFCSPNRSDALMKRFDEGKQSLSLPDKPSIAVVPFKNLTGDSKQEYIADGITENIITALSIISELFVIARNSVFTYKGNPVQVQQVREELGVRYVLEGSVLKAGERVRITAQLVDAITGHHLWAEKFDRTISDFFDLLDEIAQMVVIGLDLFH
jgi:adenylate cyclase